MNFSRYRRQWLASILVVLTALLFIPQCANRTTAKPSAWLATSSMTTIRVTPTATLLPNGMVLIAGGANSTGLLASAELYDPTRGTWTRTGSMSTPRYHHTATLLPNGKVLVVGGVNGQSTGYYLASAELYDPMSGTWARTGDMTTARHWHTATLLLNGKVLVAGGANRSGSSSYLASAELYDPTSGTWTPTGSMTAAREVHTATLLPNGKVLVAGGVNRSGSSSHLASAELYDPTRGTWSPTGSMPTSRAQHTATLLRTGNVLVAGGIGCVGSSCTTLTTLAHVELYNPASGTWSPTGSMNTGGLGHTATLLSNGKVLIAGGGNDRSRGYYVARAELYDPASGTWSPIGSMPTERAGHTATLLSNGKVLIAGGRNHQVFLASAEVYDG